MPLAQRNTAKRFSSPGYGAHSVWPRKGMKTGGLNWSSNSKPLVT